MEVLVSSFDLLENPLFSVPKRPDALIPMPFILNDAVVVKKKLPKKKPIEAASPELESEPQPVSVPKTAGLETN